MKNLCWRSHTLSSPRNDICDTLSSKFSSVPHFHLHWPMMQVWQKIRHHMFVQCIWRIRTTMKYHAFCFLPKFDFLAEISTEYVLRHRWILCCHFPKRIELYCIPLQAQSPTASRVSVLAGIRHKSEMKSKYSSDSHHTKIVVIFIIEISISHKITWGNSMTQILTRCLHLSMYTFSTMFTFLQTLDSKSYDLLRLAKFFFLLPIARNHKIEQLIGWGVQLGL